MTVKQYLRKSSLVIGNDTGNALDLSELRFAFAVRRGDYQTPNSADIRVYNVSDATADSIMQTKPTPEFTRVVLQAGYDGNFGVIFDGTITQVRHGRESQTDTYLDITAADGDRAYNFAVSSFALAAGQTPNDQIAAIMKDMEKHGVTTGYVPDLKGNPLPRGAVIFGMCRDLLRKVAKDTQSSWSIQDGKVNFVPLDSCLPGPIPVITSASGMVGLPEQTQNGIRLKCLLNPNLRVGQAVKLNNKSIQRQRYDPSVNGQAQAKWDQQTNKIETKHDGLYYVMVANHNGDTRGNDWYTDLICLAIDATASKELIDKTVAPDLPGLVRIYG